MYVLVTVQMGESPGVDAIIGAELELAADLRTHRSPEWLSPKNEMSYQMLPSRDDSAIGRPWFADQS